MRHRFLFALALVAVSGAAAAQSMNAEEFHRRATALEKKGALAIFSGGEIKTLTTEGQAAGKASVARLRADKAAGRPTRFCPPTGQQKMGSDEYMRRLSAIPQADGRGST